MIIYPICVKKVSIENTVKVFATAYSWVSQENPFGDYHFGLLIVSFFCGSLFLKTLGGIISLSKSAIARSLMRAFLASPVYWGVLPLFFACRVAFSTLYDGLPILP